MFGPGRPEFVFPPPEVAIIGSIVDVGDKLARNDAARELIARLIKEFDRRKMKDYPTVMMLKICLEKHGIPIKTVPFEELGLKGKWQRMDGGAGSN